jgi:transaldolase
MLDSKFKSPLHEMTETMATDFWNDSCAIDELTYALEYGAAGATTNPVIVGNVLKQDQARTMTGSTRWCGACRKPPKTRSRGN